MLAVVKLANTSNEAIRLVYVTNEILIMEDYPKVKDIVGSETQS